MTAPATPRQIARECASRVGTVLSLDGAADPIEAALREAMAPALALLANAHFTNTSEPWERDRVLALWRQP